jgi:predicted alpha/beta superfamily hydrolase
MEWLRISMYFNGLNEEVSEMYKTILLICLQFFLINLVNAERIKQTLIDSSILGEKRMVRVYTPPSYETKTDKHYPVLYVHDGQNVFSTVGSFVAFGWGSWNLDGTADKLIEQQKMREIIIVTIDCGMNRYTEYRGPAYPYSEEEIASMTHKPSAPGDNTAYENYKKFIIEELKPHIDKTYRTLSDRRHTGLLGSSMGGLCSLVMAWERPDIFGKTACMSGSFQVEEEYFLTEVIKRYRSKPKPIQIYLDSGTVSRIGKDDGYERTEEVAKELRRIGWFYRLNLLHYVDEKPMTMEELNRFDLKPHKKSEALINMHNEFYWRNRVWRPLVFLFPPIISE